MKRLHKTLERLLLAACLLTCATSVAQASNGDSAQAYRRGYNLILDENWQGAVAAFDKLIELYPESDWVDDAAFWRCYAREQLGEPAAELFDCYELLLERYSHSEWEDDARRALVRLAHKLDREGRPEYREKVRDFGQGENADRLLAILVALGEIGDERSVQVILERLETTQDEQLRASIVEVLEDVESELALAKLQELLANDPSERVRFAALETLADHDSFDSAPLLRDIVKDPSQPIRMRLEALDELGDDEPPGLLHFLKEIAVGENDALAMEAIDEIGHIETEETVRVLVHVLDQSPDYKRRVEVLDALEDLVELDSAIDALLEVARNDPDPRMRREARTPSPQDGPQRSRSRAASTHVTCTAMHLKTRRFSRAVLLASRLRLALDMTSRCSPASAGRSATRRAHSRIRSQCVSLERLLETIRLGVAANSLRTAARFAERERWFCFCPTPDFCRTRRTARSELPTRGAISATGNPSPSSFMVSTVFSGRPH